MRWAPVLAVGMRLFGIGFSAALAYTAARHGHPESAAVLWFTVCWLAFHR
jgi:nitric oxide reductase large subunit